MVGYFLLLWTAKKIISVVESN